MSDRGSIRRLSGSWTRPNAPKRINRPSWIGVPRSAFEAVAAQLDAEDAMPEEPITQIRPSLAAQLSRASVGPPPMDRSLVEDPLGFPNPPANLVSIARASIAPSIASTREIELENEILSLRGEIAKLALALSSVRSSVVEEAEPEIVRLALAVASRIVGREVAADPTVLAQWVEEGARVLPNRSEMTVAVAPDIADLLGETERLAGRPLLVDPNLTPGACEVREGVSVAEVGADARLAAMADALGVDS